MSSESSSEDRPPRQVRLRATVFGHAVVRRHSCACFAAFTSPPNLAAKTACEVLIAAFAGSQTQARGGAWPSSGQRQSQTPGACVCRVSHAPAF